MALFQQLSVIVLSLAVNVNALTKADLPLLGFLERSKIAEQQVVHGQWSVWSSWADCSQSCDYGHRNRSRTCDNPLPSNGGQFCTGISTQTRSCWLKFCKIDGGWSEWSQWSECSSYCYGQDLQRRYRSCSNPRPEKGGGNCDGKGLEKRYCGMKLCPSK